MDVAVARQAIFNPKGQVEGYELLFRSGLENSLSEIQDGDRASAQVLSNSLLKIGFPNITNGKKAFIRFTRPLLLQDLTFLFPPEQLVVELLEDIRPDQEVIDTCKGMKNHGYTLAFADFVLNEGYELLADLADIIKVDFTTASSEKRKELGKRSIHEKTSFLAQKVENQRLFQEAGQLGYRYCQGYFFSEPILVTGRTIPNHTLTFFRLLQVLNQSVIDFKEAEQVVESDVALTYELLRYINTAAFALVRRIESVGHALKLLGPKNVRRLLSLVALSSMVKDKPEELLTVSLVRARFLESLADSLEPSRPKFDLYLLGLFSMIDAVLGVPMSEALGHLPVSEEIKDTLSGEPGPLRELLDAVISYEKGEWKGFSSYAERAALSESSFPNSYFAAVQGAEKILPV